jgi:hypothetical protein
MSQTSPTTEAIIENQPYIPPSTMAEKYPAYYKDVRHLNEIDIYATHKVFNLIDPTGCLHHSSKKILLSGTRTGGKPAHKDIKEARDTLTRWLQLNGHEK